MKKKTLFMTALLVVSISLVAVVPVFATETTTGACTPGYWKNHTDAWVGYKTSDSFNIAFGVVDQDTQGMTLLEALRARYAALPDKSKLDLTLK